MFHLQSTNSDGLNQCFPSSANVNLIFQFSNAPPTIQSIRNLESTPAIHRRRTITRSFLGIWVPWKHV